MQHLFYFGSLCCCFAFLPNGAMSSGVITNYSKLDTRRIEWNFGVDYGEDYNKVEKVLREIIANDKRILTSPAPFIELGELAASSVNIKIRGTACKSC